MRPGGPRISVDGDLDEAAWRRAQAIPLRWETSPGDNTPAPVATECRVTFDEENLYFGCDAQDPDPSALRAFVTDRDQVGSQDRIVVLVDPFNDSRRAMEFVVNPLGVQGDRFYDEQRGFPDGSWDAIWASAGKIVDHGYRIEAAVPFRSLRFPDDGGERTWGAHVRWVWPRSDHVEMRSLRLDQADGCLLCQANLLIGFYAVSPGKNVEVVPTVTGSRSDEPGGGDVDGCLEAGPVRSEARVSLRWSPQLGPDAERHGQPRLLPGGGRRGAARGQPSLRLFLPERRPFFLEGADLFRTPIRAVFTRTIADPMGGARVTGKAGGWAGGLLVTRDRINNLLLPGNHGSARTSLQQDVTSIIGRFRRDVGESSTVGGLHTGRVGVGGYYPSPSVAGGARAVPPLRDPIPPGDRPGVRPGRRTHRRRRRGGPRGGGARTGGSPASVSGAAPGAARSGVSMRPDGRLGFGFSARPGPVIDFAHARKADGLRVAPRVDLRVGRRSRLTLEHTLQHLSLDGEEIFTANLTELRAVHNFSSRAFVGGTFQHRHTERNPALRTFFFKVDYAWRP